MLSVLIAQFGARLFAFGEQKLLDLGDHCVDVGGAESHQNLKITIFYEIKQIFSLTITFFFRLYIL
ncbi:MAG: hypothetical protein K2I48_08055, partial [Muribaculaceae bacterium]|nr:hypothetical protein [Muribaculaceae bacterium]